MVYWLQCLGLTWKWDTWRQPASGFCKNEVALAT